MANREQGTTKGLEGGGPPGPLSFPLLLLDGSDPEEQLAVLWFLWGSPCSDSILFSHSPSHLRPLVFVGVVFVD